MKRFTKTNKKCKCGAFYFAVNGILLLTYPPQYKLICFKCTNETSESIKLVILDGKEEL